MMRKWKTLRSNYCRLKSLQAQEKRVNKIITLDGKRSINQIRNKDTICLARAIAAGLAVNNREKLGDIFRNNLTEDDLKQINKTKETKSQINEDILFDNEKKYLVNGKKIARRSR